MPMIPSLEHSVIFNLSNTHVILDGTSFAFNVSIIMTQKSSNLKLVVEMAIGLNFIGF